MASAKTPERPFLVKPPSAWVRPVPLAEKNTVPEGETSGVHYALTDVQVRVDGSGEELYSHHTRRVLTESGIEEAAEIDISFDPTFEQLTLHGVWVHRDGQRLDVLDPTAVKVIQQERELDQRIYNGTLSALIFVRDVRAGDLIEYAFTTRGANPIFGGHFFTGFSLRTGAPLGHWRVRLLWPASRTLYVKNHGLDLAPTVTEAGGVREYVWEQRDVPALTVDDTLPAGYNPLPWLQLSEFENWAAVVRWALPLYATPPKLSPALEAEVKRLRAAHATASARLLGALRFVQDEVRYLGIEMGPNSHRPHAPEEVLARRFGDCKDKTLLLLTLLRELGIQARPALVHTDWRQGLDAMHPSPGAFDHVIAQVHLEGRDYWMDPTSSQERGPLEAWPPPPFRRALLVDAASTGLVEIPEPTLPEPTLDVEEAYVEDASGGGAALTVTSRWSGARANDMRLQLATSSLKKLEREYLNFYARRDPKIRSAAPLSVTDNPDQNVLTVVERYAIDTFWTDGRRDFHASELSRHLEQPRISQRTMPLGVQHPLHVRQRIRVDMKHPITIDREQDTLTGPASEFEYRYATENGGQRLLLEYRYRSLKDSVEPSRFLEHLEVLKRMDRHTGYQVTLSQTPARRARIGGGGFSMFGVAVGLGALAVGGLLMMMDNGPRAFLRELQARGRKRAFSRKFAPSEGDLPSQAIALEAVDALPERLARLRCECGTSRGTGGAPPKLEEILLGDESLVLAKWTCAACGRARHAYFSVGAGKAA